MLSLTAIALGQAPRSRESDVDWVDRHMAAARDIVMPIGTPRGTLFSGSLRTQLRGLRAESAAPLEVLVLSLSIRRTHLPAAHCTRLAAGSLRDASVIP
jgi:hypothetical protein